MNICQMFIEDTKLKAFLKYKKSKLNSISTIENNRLMDLKNARETVFKYALPSAIIDALAGGFGTLVTNNFLLLLPVSLFVILIFFLADTLDRIKYSERIEIIEYSEQWLYFINSQEKELLRRS